MALEREDYKAQARQVNSVSALVIRHCGGMYFAGFGGKPDQPKVNFASFLAGAKLFNATAQSQAEKYIERIKKKDSLLVGLKVVKVGLFDSDRNERG